MFEKQHIKIPLEKDGWTRKVESLCWKGDSLVDYVGCCVYQLDGTITNRGVSYAYRFDRAIPTPDEEYTIIYETYGTKGLVLKQNSILREINRSYYCADAYGYPVTTFRTTENRLCIAHCPEHYNVLEIEDIETGERLTAADRESQDFFQSRLQASPNGKFVLSAGWIWHPVDSIQIFDISASISNPTVIDLFRDEAFQTIGLFEIHTAAFADDSTLILTGNDEDNEKIDYICVFDLEKMQIISKAVLPETAGELMPLNGDFAVGFYEHPKLINIKTGETLERWTDISSGTQNSSINVQNNKYPPIAVDRKNKRFAVADANSIHVVKFNNL